jgi:hypothetical protein
MFREEAGNLHPETAPSHFCRKKLILAQKPTTGRDVFSLRCIDDHTYSLSLGPHDEEQNLPRFYDDDTCFLATGRVFIICTETQTSPGLQVENQLTAEDVHSKWHIAEYSIQATAYALQGGNTGDFTVDTHTV